MTAASLDGRIGRRSERCGLTLLERGWAHMVASDAHEAVIRPVGMSEAVARIGDESLAHWLTDAVPRAVVDGGALPPRPDVQPRRRLRRWR